MGLWKRGYSTTRDSQNRSRQRHLTEKRRTMTTYSSAAVVLNQRTDIQLYYCKCELCLLLRQPLSMFRSVSGVGLLQIPPGSSFRNILANRMTKVNQGLRSLGCRFLCSKTPEADARGLGHVVYACRHSVGALARLFIHGRRYIKHYPKRYIKDIVSTDNCCGLRRSVDD